MKKILFLAALFLMPSLIAQQQKDTDLDDVEIDYSLMKKDRTSVENAIKDSQADCIDNVIGLLSSLEQEQNMRQSAQQEATSCRLELEDLKADKTKRKSKKNTPDEITQVKRLEAALQQNDAELKSERKITDDALTQVKAMQKAADLDRQEVVETRKTNAQLQSYLSERDADVQELKKQLVQTEKEFEQNKRALFDVQSVLATERDAWKEEKIKFEEQLKNNQTTASALADSTDRTAKLEASLASVQEDLKRMAKLEAELNVTKAELKDAYNQARDAATLKEQAEKRIAALSAQIKQLEKAGEKTVDQELEEAKTAERMEQNRTVAEKINTQMGDLIAQLTHIQTLLPVQQ